jgi:hypothetical protein
LGVVGAWENVEGIKQGEKENRDRFNGSPRLSFFTAKRREERKNFKRPPHPVLIIRMRGIRVYLIKSILFVFVNFGVLNV